MRLPMAGLAAGLALGAALAGGSAQAASVEVKNAVARVTVIPENRSDIKVEFVSRNARLPLQVRTFAGRTIIDGDLKMNRIGGCRGDGPGTRVNVRGVGQVAWNDMPQIVIRTPRDVNIGAGGAVFGVIGRAGSVDLSNAGCGDWTVADVGGALKVSQAGSGGTRAGKAGAAHVRIAGSGDVATGEIAGAVDVEVAGSGDVAIRQVAGPLQVRIAGSGDVHVAGGHASAMEVSVAGSGDVDFGGVADNLKARVMGSGDVHAREVRGAVSKTVMGSGAVTVG